MKLSKLIVAAVVVVVGAGGATIYLNSKYWAAHRIGDAELRYLSLDWLKKSLGEQPAFKIPGPSAKAAFRLEKNVSIGSLLQHMGVSDPRLAESMRQLRDIEESASSGPLVLGEASEQIIATFGHGIVEAGFHVPSEDPAMLPDGESAVWIRVSSPFHGSIYGVHLGDPWAKAEVELRRRGAVAATGFLTGSHFMSINEIYTPVKWMVDIACNENDASLPVTHVTTWQTGYRSVKITK